jgi:hypothetical protein
MLGGDGIIIEPIGEFPENEPPRTGTVPSSTRESAPR